jgi:hypothetical protein
VLLYPGCTFFEISLAAEVLAGAARVQFATPDGRPHMASNGSRVDADLGYDALVADPPQALLVPGGDPRAVLEPCPLAAAALQAAAARGALLAGICAGVLVIAASGLLRGRRGTHNYTDRYAPRDKVEFTARHWQGLHYVHADWVLDPAAPDEGRQGPLLTAMPWAYREFAAQAALALGLLNSDEARALVGYREQRRLG